ncbi:MAG: hypothetical protein ACREVK_02220, partial [Gammaproteobacteria bacterium]
ETWRAAHRRLYEHLCTTTPDKPEPTLEDLQPLYQAVAHGCWAENQCEAFHDVFVARIARVTGGGENPYSINRFGFGAYGDDLAALRHVAGIDLKGEQLTLKDKAEALNFAGHCLRACGRLVEAVEPLNECVKAYVGLNNLDDSRKACIAIGTLSQILLTIGDLDAALKAAKTGVTLATEIEDDKWKLRRLGYLGDVLHQMGRINESRAEFEEAALVKKRDESQPLLDELAGYLYSDLLLTQNERDAVAERTTRTLALAKAKEKPVKLTVGLDSLALGRVELQRLQTSGNGDKERASVFLNKAVENLIRASAQHHLPRGFLARAAFYAWTNDLLRAQADLDEAWEIAERGPMKLFMADIHLHRARLFFREATYPWDSPRADLAAARDLIMKCGYGRRKEELEDAEAAAEGWEVSTGHPTSDSSAIITGLEVVLDQPPQRFDQAAFMLALITLVGADVAKVRIASIRQGSTVVDLEGDGDVLGQIVLKLQESQATLDAFARAAGMRSIAWSTNGQIYRLTVEEETGPESKADISSSAAISTIAQAKGKPMLLSKIPDERHDLQPIAGCNNAQRAFDIIFIHGLGGDSWTTWMADKDDIQTFWPNWLTEDFPQAGLWTLGYEASSSKWKEESMPLADRGNQVLDLLANDGIGERPVVFITHSMGGIVAKQILRHADNFGVPRWEAMAQQAKGLAFIATPHSGANIASFAEFASAVYRTNEHVKELAAHDPRLREMHGWFLNYQRTHQVVCRTYCEKREVRPEIPLLGIKLPKGVLVVDDTSAEPNILGEPLDEDHISICKPASRKAQIYKGIMRFLRDCETKIGRPAVHTSFSHTPSTNERAANPKDLSAASRNVLNIWTERLSFLQVEEAKAVNAAEKFQLLKEIETAKAKIREYGGRA